MSSWAPDNIREWMIETNKRLAVMERRGARTREQGQIRLTATTDASLTSTEHAFQIGPDTGSNLIMDQNEIMARTNGAVSQILINGDGGDVVLGGTQVTAGTVNIRDRLRLPSTGDVSPSSTGHPFQIGPDDGINVGIDNNQLQGRNNGAVASYGINSEGGNVTLGDSAATVSVPGVFNTPQLPMFEAKGRTNIAASGVTTVSYPGGRFSVVPVFTAVVIDSAQVAVAHVTNRAVGSVGVRIYNLGGTQISGTIEWAAAQMSANAATG